MAQGSIKNKQMLGMKRATCLTEFRKTKTWLENEGNADYFKRTKEEFSELSPEDKELFRKRATERGIPSTMKDRQSYANLLTDQMTNVRKVVEQMGGFVSFHLILDGEHRRAASTQMCLIEERLQYARDLTSLVAQSERKQKNLSEATAVDGDRGAKKDEKQELRRQVQAVLNKAYREAVGKPAAQHMRCPYSKLPSMEVKGWPEGVARIKNPNSYGRQDLKRILDNKEHIVFKLNQEAQARTPLLSPDEPSIAEPGVAEPGVAQPGVAQPGVAQPGVAQPGVTKPSQNEPSDSVIDLRDMAKMEEDTVIGILNLLSEGGAVDLPVEKESEGEEQPLIKKPRGDKTSSDAKKPHLAKRSRKVDLPVEKESEGEEQPLIKKPRAPKTSTTPGDTESSSPSTLVIGLGVAGGVCVVMAAVGAGVYFRKRRLGGQQNAPPDNIPAANIPPANIPPDNIPAVNIPPDNGPQVAGPSTDQTVPTTTHDELDESNVDGSEASEASEASEGAEVTASEVSEA